jgi:tRNA-splicing ligase RtcB
MLNGKDILALGWPAGKVVGLGLKTARTLEGRGLPRVEVLEGLEDIRRDPGGALERESEGPVAELAREWVRLGADEARASSEELRDEPLPYRVWGAAGVDEAARLQMETALRLPVAEGGALMADAGYLTLGLGAEDSVNSAAHGAGRRMSRTRAFKELDRTAWREDLREKGITLLGGALAKAPKAYKDPSAVMASQADLVEAVGEFSPRIVRMDAESKKDRRKRKPKTLRTASPSSGWAPEVGLRRYESSVAECPRTSRRRSRAH